MRHCPPVQTWLIEFHELLKITVSIYFQALDERLTLHSILYIYIITFTKRIENISTTQQNGHNKKNVRNKSLLSWQLYAPYQVTLFLRKIFYLHAPDFYWTPDFYWANWNHGWKIVLTKSNLVYIRKNRATLGRK